MGSYIQTLPAQLTINQQNSPQYQRALQAGKDIETEFLNTLMAQMNTGLETDDEFSGGFAGETFRGMLNEHYAKAVTSKGGIGLAEQIARQLLDLQEI